MIDKKKEEKKNSKKQTQYKYLFFQHGAREDSYGGGRVSDHARHWLAVVRTQSNLEALGEGA